MGYALMGLGGICSLISLVCWVIILIDALKNEVWKGLLMFLCGLYTVYYSFTEFDHEKQMQIAIGYLAGSLLGGVLVRLGASLIGG